MFQKSKICAAALLALSSGAVLTAMPAFAQESLERVEITGSSIKRVDVEGALPVITLTRKDIEKTGATSVRDLIQNMPSMQGFTTNGESVNGQGGGTSTASLRNLGEKYTLVLLNGRRVAPFDTGSTVNLEQLPISAIERVEVLADGASALYGADAVAGVVNFITRQNTDKGEIDIRFVAPERAGGKQANLSISKGIGNFERDGFNVFAAFSYDKEDRILASQRPWSKTGVIPFTGPDGSPLYFFQTSINADPPNVELGDDTDTLAIFNPVLAATGKCGSNPNSFARGSQCRFDYGATVDLVPENERKNLYLSGQVKLNKDFRLHGEAFLSDSSVKAGYAPPAQPLAFDFASPLYAKYITPQLAGLGLSQSDLTYGVYYMRLADAGQRKDDYRTKGQHISVGVDGTLAGFDVAATYTHSATNYTDTTIGGYTSRTAMDALIASGKWDPFAQGTDASRAAIAPALLNTKQFDVDSKLDTFSLRGSGSVFKMGGREAMLGAGVDFTKQSYKNIPGSIFQGPNVTNPDETDFPVGASNGSLPTDASRNSYGAFAELLVPVTRSFEVTAAVRYDSFDRIKNNYIFTDPATLLPPGEQGNDASKATYKLAFRFQPDKQWLLRGSVGTGFRAPTLFDVVRPLQEFGVIGVQRACPVTDATDPLYVGCRTNPHQYTAYVGGNAFQGNDGLKPETSDQWTVGTRWEPSNDVSLGLDLWNVKIKNAITTVPEDTAFDNFAQYRSLFSITTDAATGRPILTFNQISVNSAVRVARGLDWDFTVRNRLGIGNLTTRFTGTYMIDSYFDLGFGGGKESSLNKLGSDDQVAARVLTRVQATLDSGKFSNTLTWNWRPGYMDQTYSADDATVFVRNPNGSRGAPVAIAGHRVQSYSTIDWQGKVELFKGLTLTAGIKNLMDKAPPLTIKTVAGNQLGVDSRYHDVIGRTFYLQGNYKF